jgi:hypothetical protein
MAEPIGGEDDGEETAGASADPRWAALSELEIP